MEPEKKMSRGFYLSFLICVFFLAVAIPALAITVGPDTDTTACEEDVLVYPSKMNMEATAYFKVRHEDPKLGEYLDAAHYQLAMLVSDYSTKIIFQAIEPSFEKDFEFDKLVLMKAQDRQMKVVGQLAGYAFPQRFDSVQTDSELTVRSPNFSRLFLKELMDNESSKPNQDALKSVVTKLSHQVDPELARRGVKDVVLVVIDAREVPLHKGYEFVTLHNSGSMTIYDKLLNQIEKLSAKWEKEGVWARFLLRGKLNVESSGGRELYVPVFDGVGTPQAKDTPAQYGVAQTRFFPRQVTVRTGLDSSVKVNLVPAPRK